MKFEKPLKATKTDRYGLDVNNWLDGQALSSFTVTAESGSNITVGTVSNDNGIISVLLTGADEGKWKITFEYQTTTRSDCQTVNLYVIPDCN